MIPALRYRIPDGRLGSVAMRRARRATNARKSRSAANRVNARRAEAGPDRVVCLLCGKLFRAIRVTHLWARHGFEGNHPVRDYKARFGLRVAASRASCRRSRLVRVGVLKRTGTYWPRKRVLGELRKRNRGTHSLAPSRLPSNLQQAILRRFGTWESALRRAGVDPREHRLTRTWDDATLVAEVRRAVDRNGELSDKKVHAEHPALHSAALNRVGSWGAALRLAGLDPREHRQTRRWNVEIGRAWVRATHRAGRPIISRYAPSALVAVIRRRTGLTWAEFVESIGIEYPGGHKRYDWTNAAVVAAIRDRRRRGLPLNRQAVRRDGQAVTHQARLRFGSWDAALRAAGVDPADVRKNRTWTRSEVLSAIRRRHASNRAMHRVAAYADEPRLVKAAQRMFPYSWRRALEAAGIDSGRGSRIS